MTSSAHDSRQRGSARRRHGRGAAVSVRGVAKTFAGARALRGVDVAFRPGEIHALCGGNGSGKSTLIKILCGVHRADEGGSLVVGNETIDADKTTPAQAHRLGIRVVHQDLAVFPELTVAENLAIDSAFETGFAWRIRWSKQRRLAEEAIGALDIPATPRTPLSKLPLAARAQVAIARALRGGDEDATTRSGLLILDEPTAALPVHEVRTLLKSLRQLAPSSRSSASARAVRSSARSSADRRIMARMVLGSSNSAVHSPRIRRPMRRTYGLTPSCPFPAVSRRSRTAVWTW